MFIRVARQFLPAAFLLIPLLGVLLWLPAFNIDFTPRAQVSMPLYRLIEWFPSEFPLASKITALLLVGLQALGFNYFTLKHQLFTKRSYLPALFFIVFASCSMGLLRFHPAMVASIFLLPAIYLMLDTYRMDTAYSKVFYTGLLVALASLIYFPALVFALFFIACLVILRPFIWREWIILMLGLLVPYVYAGTYYFLADQSPAFWSGMIVQPIVHRDFFLSLPVSYYLLSGIIILLLLAAAGRFVAGAGAATLKTRKGISCMIWLAVFSVVAGIPAQDFGVAGFYFAVMPLAVFVSNIFLLARRTWLAELFFVLLLLGIATVYVPFSTFNR